MNLYLNEEKGIMSSNKLLHFYLFFINTEIIIIIQR